MPSSVDLDFAENASTALCLKCNYPLIGLTSRRCPECGEPFDPSNPQTVNLYKPLGRMARWLLQPTRWLAPAAPWIAALGISCTVAFVLPDKLALLLLAFLWAIVALPYLFFSGIAFWVILGKQATYWRRKKDLDARYRIAKCFLIAAAIVLTHIPGRLLFWVSRPALDRYANHLFAEIPLSATSKYMPPRFCGCCYVAEPHVEVSGVYLLISSRDVAYCPYGQPQNNWRAYYRSLGGNWYEFYSDQSPDYW